MLVFSVIASIVVLARCYYNVFLLLFLSHVMGNVLLFVLSRFVRVRCPCYLVVFVLAVLCCCYGA